MTKFLPLFFVCSFFLLSVQGGITEEGRETGSLPSGARWVSFKKDSPSLRYLLENGQEGALDEMKGWIRQLEADSFQARVKAEDSLLRKGPGIIPFLERQLPRCKPESYLRVKRVIRKLWLSAW